MLHMCKLHVLCANQSGLRCRLKWYLQDYSITVCWGQVLNPKEIPAGLQMLSTCTGFLAGADLAPRCFSPPSLLARNTPQDSVFVWQSKRGDNGKCNATWRHSWCGTIIRNNSTTFYILRQGVRDAEDTELR